MRRQIAIFCMHFWNSLFARTARARYETCFLKVFFLLRRVPIFGLLHGLLYCNHNLQSSPVCFLRLTRKKGRDCEVKDDFRETEAVCSAAAAKRFFCIPLQRENGGKKLFYCRFWLTNSLRLNRTYNGLSDGTFSVFGAVFISLTCAKNARSRFYIPLVTPSCWSNGLVSYGWVILQVAGHAKSLFYQGWMESCNQEIEREGKERSKPPKNRGNFLPSTLFLLHPKTHLSCSFFQEKKFLLHFAHAQKKAPNVSFFSWTEEAKKS